MLVKERMMRVLIIAAIESVQSAYPAVKNKMDFAKMTMSVKMILFVEQIIVKVHI